MPVHKLLLPGLGHAFGIGHYSVPRRGFQPLMHTHQSMALAEDLWCLSTVYIRAITRLGQLPVIPVSIVGQTMFRFACAIVSRLKDVWRTKGAPHCQLWQGISWSRFQMRYPVGLLGWFFLVPATLRTVMRCIHPSHACLIADLSAVACSCCCKAQLMTEGKGTV